MPVQQTLTTIIINWNLKERTAACLRALAQADDPPGVILVDNGSTDGSAAYFQAHFPWVQLIRLPENVGFGAACNIGVRRALNQRANDLVLLLNNDTTVPSDFFVRLRQAAHTYPETAIFGPKILWQNAPDTIWYAGARRRRWVLAAADTGRGQRDRGQFDRARPVDYVFGAAMLIRSQVFRQIGLFDERFFMYLEDLDFCLRAQQAKLALLYIPAATVFHQGSASTTRLLSLRKYHQTRSTILFLRKHLQRRLLLPGVVFWSLVLGKTLLGDLRMGTSLDLRAYSAGCAAGLTGTQPKVSALNFR